MVRDKTYNWKLEFDNNFKLFCDFFLELIVRLAIPGNKYKKNISYKFLFYRHFTRIKF